VSLHRWHAGGSSPSLVALALAHVGSPTSAKPPIPSDAVQERLLAFLEDESNELAVVHRHVLDDEKVECSYDTEWDPSADDWTDALGRRSRLKGELFLFDDSKLVSAKAERSSDHESESRTGQHGYYLIDGFLPHADGRIVIGGAY
jgi:hypothetical protein